MKSIIPLLIAFSLLLIPSQAFAKTTDPRPIAIQGAMPEEVQYFLEVMNEYDTETFDSYTYYIGKIDSIPVVVSRTEVGMVNAAASTTLLIEKYNPRAIINQGTSGGHDPDLHRYDIVVGEKAINFGKILTNHKDEGTGMSPDSWKIWSTTIRVDGEKVSFPYFEPDPTLYKAAMGVAEKYTHGKVVSGVIGSADEWNRELDRIKWIHENAGTSVEEMETAAAAQTAKVLQVPFLGIRILSNSEWYPDEVYEPETSGKYCAEFVIEVLKATSQADFSYKPEIVVPENQVKINNGKRMVPLRSIMIKLGADVKWDPALGKVIVNHDGYVVEFKSGENEYSTLENGITWVELEWLQERFDFEVSY
ncbi:MTA/SAH nucleosidase [Paenibacillus sp. sptzw28]|uniref:phosphorylase family protein n=1 Tax=Paenibacillus sp. sptzw28 TaxID=715179 RepID=UPI001C6DE64B|nr:stalk domain-containing protein [Paenibacillus sp. sptzw28]QYR23565.1 MTA/SAH nucleosidase [Paenibacillus sp. sptzw28]